MLTAYTHMDQECSTPKKCHKQTLRRKTYEIKVTDLPGNKDYQRQALELEEYLRDFL